MMQRSFVFRKRVQTPPVYLRQQDLAKQLEAQIKWKQDEQRAERQEKDFVERVEQIQLAEAYVHTRLLCLMVTFSAVRLAQERETYIRNKRLHQEEMKSTLDNQVSNGFFTGSPLTVANRCEASRVDFLPTKWPPRISV